jgi:hypothetical protein
MKNHLVIVTVLVLLNLLVYAQVSSFDFINLDDRKFVHVYPHLDTGIGPEGIRHAFLEPYLANYTPISTLSYHLDYALYGIDGGGFHLTNLLFHVLNSILLYLVLFHLTRALWPASPDITVEEVLSHPRNKERYKLFEPIKDWEYIWGKDE